MPSMLPRPVVHFTPPSRPEDLSKRLHNKFAKEALRETLEEHWAKNTRKHFQLHARHRYGYAPRSKNYNLFKKRVKGHTIDMLFSGRTRARMTGTRPTIQIGGAAEGGKKGISGVYRLKFPFSGEAQAAMAKRGRRLKAGLRVRPRTSRLPQLKKEMGRWAGDEVTAAKEGFVRRYVEKVNNYRGNRKRKRMPTS